MDEKIVKIVASKLRKYEGEPMTQDKLESIREAVYSATKTNKSASFSNVKKWIKAARSMIRRQEKEGAKPSKKQPQKARPIISAREPEIPQVSRKVEDSVNLIKEDSTMSPSAPSHEVAFPKPQIVFDKVYLQSIKFDIAGIRQTMERVSRQLDKLEKELSSHGDD